MAFPNVQNFDDSSSYFSASGKTAYLEIGRVDAEASVADGVRQVPSTEPLDTLPVTWITLSTHGESPAVAALNQTVQIPANRTCYVGVFAGSTEFPDWTGQSSVFNDKLTWNITAMGNDSHTGEVFVNSENEHFRMARQAGNMAGGLPPAVFLGGGFYSAPENAALDLTVALTAADIGDSLRASTIAVGVFPLSVVQWNMPQPDADCPTTDSGLSYTRALIPASGVAYITGQPRPPDLYANIRGLPYWVPVSWRVNIRTERSERLTLDDRNLRLLNGTSTLPLTMLMRNEIVGGRVDMYMQVSNTVRKLYKFYIRGKNPKDEDVVNYINSHVDAEFRDYAWMIAKHESWDQYTQTYYNQFNPSDRLTELPFKSGGERYYGWGIAQIDKGQTRSVTAEVYDWHENIQSMNETLRPKRTLFLSFMADYRRAYSQDISWVAPPATYTMGNLTLPFEAWGVLTLYNGAGGIEWQELPGQPTKIRSPWEFCPGTAPSSGRWVLHQNSKNYTQAISNEFGTEEDD